MSFTSDAYGNPNPAFPPVILNLLIANGMVFFFMTFFPAIAREPIFFNGALWPLGADLFRPWQLITYGFIHGGFAHIFFNMLALWMFGREIELRWGSKRFLTYYGVCVVGAGICQLGVATAAFNAGGGPYPTVGASGGTYGILLAFGLLFPYRRIMLLFPPIPMEARYFVIVFGCLELFLGVSGLSPRVAHFAHLGGMLFGGLIILYWRGKLPIKPKRRMIW